MKMLVRAALLLSAVSAVPAHAAIVPSGSTYGDKGAFQVGVVNVPASILVDSSGTEVNLSSIGGGTQYTEDAAAAGNPVGNALICVRRDTLTVAEVSADGDNVALKCDSEGKAYVSAPALAALLTTIDADTGNMLTELTAIKDYLDTVETKLAAIQTAAEDTSATSVKISQSTTENDVDANIGINAPVRIVSAAGTTEDETQVCAAACYVLRISGYNAAAATRYIKFTNATAANTTPGTTAVYWSIPIPATSPFSVPVEQYFSTAATVYLVTGSADNDVAEVTAGDILGLAVTTK